MKASDLRPFSSLSIENLSDLIPECYSTVVKISNFFIRIGFTPTTYQGGGYSKRNYSRDNLILIQSLYNNSSPILKVIQGLCDPLEFDDENVQYRILAQVNNILQRYNISVDKQGKIIDATGNFVEIDEDIEVLKDALQVKDPTQIKYEVAISYAGEDRDYVQKVASYLLSKQIYVFYDQENEVDLWGKKLDDILQQVYNDRALFCVMFLSEHYAHKTWPTYEKKQAIQRSLQENKEYILPVRFDDTTIPDLDPSIVFVDLRNITPEQLGEMIMQKIIMRYRSKN